MTFNPKSNFYITIAKFKPVTFIFNNYGNIIDAILKNEKKSRNNN